MADAPEAGNRGGTTGDGDAARHARLEELFARRVEPLLPELAALQAKYRAWCLGGLGAVALIFLFVFAADAFGFSVLGLVVLFFAAGALVHFSRLYRDKVRGTLTPVVCEAIGGISHRTGGAQEVVERLRRLQLVNSFGNDTVDDVFDGSHDGTGFLMAEVKLFNRVTKRTGSGSNRQTTTTDKIVFKGLVFLIATPKPIEARIILRGPVSWFGHRWRRTDRQLRDAGYAPVAVPDAGFARYFTLWSDAGEAALEVVGPALAATLTRLAASAGRKRIDAAFLGSRFILLLPKGGNSFSVGGLFRPLSRLRAEAHALMEEIMVVHRLIEVLKGREV